MDECDGDKLHETFVRVIKSASFVAGVACPVVGNLAKTWEKLRPLSIVINSIEAGLKEAVEHINCETGEKNVPHKSEEG